MKLTIFTPTYNRAYTLSRLYESLLSQTSRKFEWLIVDDGSTDATEELVEEWISEQKIPIRYYRQTNKGKHIAHNLGVEKAHGKIFTCLDSDDWFYKDTVEKILDEYSRIDNENVIGLIGLDTFKNGEIVGEKFPGEVSYSNWIDLNFKFNLKGDKAITFFTSVLKNHPFPENDNKHMPPSYQLYSLDRLYEFKLINEPLKYVEYLDDGITSNIRKKYLVAPDNYTEYRRLMMKITPSYKFKVKNAIHYNITRYLIGSKEPQSPLKFNERLLTWIVYPLSIIAWKIMKKRDGVLL